MTVVVPGLAEGWVHSCILACAWYHILMVFVKENRTKMARILSGTSEGANQASTGPAKPSKHCHFERSAARTFREPGLPARESRNPENAWDINADFGEFSPGCRRLTEDQSAGFVSCQPVILARWIPSFKPSCHFYSGIFEPSSDLLLFLTHPPSTAVTLIANNQADI